MHSWKSRLNFNIRFIKQNSYKFNKNFKKLQKSNKQLYLKKVLSQS